ncbi:hypothetical protein, partial [Amycolatopsis regifaucium]
RRIPDASPLPEAATQGYAAEDAIRLKFAAAAMTNARGRTIHVAGQDYEWLTVVVIDHADPPRGTCLPRRRPGFPRS